MPKVYSTLSADLKIVNYKLHDPSTRKLPTVIDSLGGPVTIRGGANIATDPESRGGRHTPRGVMTDITEEQLAYCRENVQFTRHEHNGHLLVISDKRDPDEVAKEFMTPADGSAPLTPASPQFQGDGDGAVKPEGLTDE